MKYTEVELKYALDDPAPLKAKLAELGAKPGAETHQIDVYYNAPHKDFLAHGRHNVSEWLRIRTEKSGSSVNFKRWHPVGAPQGGAQSRFCWSCHVVRGSGQVQDGEEQVRVVVDLPDGGCDLRVACLPDRTPPPQQHPVPAQANPIPPAPFKPSLNWAYDFAHRPGPGPESSNPKETANLRFLVLVRLRAYSP